MLEAVGHVGTGSGNGIRAASASVAAPTVEPGSNGDVPRVPLSPRMKADPEAGVVIAEYLTSRGETSVQIPSQTVVAYLRSGLSADGSSRRGALTEA